MLISVCVRAEMGTDGGCSSMASCLLHLETRMCVRVLLGINFIQGPINAARCRALNGSLCESVYRAQLKR